MLWCFAFARLRRAQTGEQAPPWSTQVFSPTRCYRAARAALVLYAGPAEPVQPCFMGKFDLEPQGGFENSTQASRSGTRTSRAAFPDPLRCRQSGLPVQPDGEPPPLGTRANPP